MHRILVTGSEGFVGRNLVKQIESSWECFTLDLRPSQREGHTAVDLANSDLPHILGKIKPTTVVHLAAQTDVRVSMNKPIDDLSMNGIGTLDLVLASLGANCKNFIYVNSGGAIYSSEGDVPYTESSPVKPDSAYGLTKQLGEDYVRLFCEKSGATWKSLALSNVYGSVAENRKGIFFEAWKSIKENRKFTVFGENVTRDYVHIIDVVSAIECAISTEISGRFNIGTGKETSNLEVFRFMKEKMRSNLEYEVRDPRPGEVLRSALDISKAESKLNWRPKIDLKSGVDKILEGLTS